MAASKDKEAKPSGLQSLAQWMHYIPGGALLFAVTPLLILGYFAWRNWGAEHLDVALYAVKIENLVTTPQPTWIRNTQVREEVFKNSGLGQLSVLDPQASATIAHAFESHSWVQRASRVQKLPGGKVTVDIVYRRPIAMVYYDGHANPSSANVKEGFFPVDEEGVVLPLADFDESQVRNYFVVIADGATPPSEIGMTYSDTRIKQALLLCRLLDSARAELRLAGITVVRDDRMGGPSPWIMHINTSDNRLINWGHAPGSESPGEPTPQEKFTNLVKWHTDASSTLQIDLTRPFVRETKLTGH
ncbi:MAG: hypothetical protein SFV81_05250 [Pirellulaceae bacterium]|nr:hypothetical protein [Pirellulaceae bacterium]